MAASQEVFLVATQILKEAVSRKASEIHLERSGDKASVAYVAGGKKARSRSLPKKRFSAVLGRFKALGKLPPESKERFQTGSFTMSVPRRFTVDVCAVSARSGERVVLKLREDA
ncbi:MAG: hypothetical protein HY554_16785 [Elusimicrobia bacterium]|nr:hypothetical protein [Elusimicrobiota bacterium]